jgi:hypothetical protein
LDKVKIKTQKRCLLFFTWQDRLKGESNTQCRTIPLIEMMMQTKKKKKREREREREMRS